MTTSYRYAAKLYLPSQSNGAKRQFYIIKELSESDYERYSDAYAYVDDIVNLNIFTYLQTTFQDFKSAVQKDVEELGSGQFNFDGQDDIVRIGTRMRSAVLAFCTALHFHQEHTYTEILLTHDQSSRLYKQVQKIFQRMHEKSPEYRLLWQVRNTMVHCTMQTITIRGGIIPNANGEDQCWTNPQIDISSIAQLNKRISDSFRRELETYEDDPSVIECITKAYPLIEEANGRILGRMYPDISGHCATIREFDSLFNGRIGTRALTKSEALTGPRNENYRGWANNVIKFAHDR